MLLYNMMFDRHGTQQIYNNVVRSRNDNDIFQWNGGHLIKYDYIICTTILYCYIIREN